MQTHGKIAVAGATGRAGRHVVDVLEAAGHDVVPISRSRGVDLVTGDGLARALEGVECVVDVATGPSSDQQAATEFFTAAARNLQAVGERAGVRRIVVASIIGCDRFAGGYPRRRSRTSRRWRRARSRCGCCAPRSSTSSSRNSWTGADRAT